MKYSALLVLMLFTSFTLTAQSFDVYVSDNDGNQIIKYDENGESPEIFIPSGVGGLDEPQDIIFLEEENIVLISCLGNNQIKKFDAETGAYLGIWAFSDTPTRIAIGPEDTVIYALQWIGTGTVLRYHLDGSFIDEFTTEGVSGSIGIAWDADTNLYVSSYYDDLIAKFSPTGEYLGDFATENVNGPTNIWFEGSELVVLNYDASNIVRFDADGNYLTTYSGGYVNPEGFAFLPDGDLLVGNRGSGAIIRVNPEDGTVIEEFTSAGGLEAPNAVVIREKEAHPSSVETNSLDEKIQVLQNNRTFTLAGSQDLFNQVKVYTIRGREIYNQPLTSTFLWDATNAAKGTYILKLTSTEGITFEKKVVLQ